ncbi:AI-2E family transporter [Nocardioides sp. KIGAM211]|uniref:AI-2E family transporter n=1 Tax=Nocardioides luti TaxID=2761101 RepID=A0A7X0VDF4_9ACTN|nr:AI-2E family transporter [Nocardioides luti]
MPEETPHVEPGPPLSPHSPFYVGFFGAVGALLAIWLGHQVLVVSSTIILIVVAAFLAVGLNPLVEFFMRRGLKRSWSVVVVIALVVVALALFLVAIVPVISDQVTQLAKNAPTWLDQLQHNSQVEKLDEQYDIIAKAKQYIADGNFASAAFGGVLGIGIAVLGALFNAFIITVLTLYFLSSLPKTKAAMYRLAPASRRPRVSLLGDQILSNVGSYVSGAFIVAVAAGLSSLVFLFVVGLGEYAVALAFVVALLDVIPMIGATIGAVIVVAIGFATDPKIGVACLIFYVIYQQVENYVIYPRVMSRSVDIPGAVIVIAALVGAGLLGVVGALLAIPTAAAILLLTKEVFIARQDDR